MLDRLVRGPVFSVAHGVEREDEDGGYLHESRRASQWRGVMVSFLFIRGFFQMPAELEPHGREELSWKSASPRELNRSYRAVVSTGTGTPSSMAALMVHRPSVQCPAQVWRRSDRDGSPPPAPRQSSCNSRALNPRHRRWFQHPRNGCFSSRALWLAGCRPRNTNCRHQ
jgi:hypothetical protein